MTVETVTNAADYQHAKCSPAIAAQAVADALANVGATIWRWRHDGFGECVVADDWLAARRDAGKAIADSLDEGLDAIGHDVLRWVG